MLAQWTLEASLGLAPAPTARMYNYFGCDLALYFSFLRLYSLWLWLPAVFGVVVFLFGESEYGGGESVWQVTRLGSVEAKGGRGHAAPLEPRWSPNLAPI